MVNDKVGEPRISENVLLFLELTVAWAGSFIDIVSILKCGSGHFICNVMIESFSKIL